MSFSEYLLGAAELALIAAALCLGAYYVRAALVPSWTGAPARLAEATLAITGLLVVSELIGVVGLFEPGFLVAGCLAAGLGAVWFARRRAPEGATVAGPPAPPLSPWMFGIGIGVAALVAVHWAMPTQQALDVGMYSQDTVWYHMSFSGRFAQEAQIGPLVITDPLKVISWFYPQNSELVHGVGISAFGHDVLSPLINIGWMVLCLLAAWCIGRPYGVAPLTLAAVAVVLDTPMMVEQAGNAPSDTIALFFLLATVALLINADAAAREGGKSTKRARRSAAKAGTAGAGSGESHASKRGAKEEVNQSKPGTAPVGAAVVTGPAGPILLAGLAAGLAIGTKITLLAAIGTLTLALLYLAKGARVRFLALWAGALAIPSAFWYGRNLIEAHNPLPWAQAGPLSGPEQLELYPRKLHTVAHYATDTSVWSDWFFPALDDRLGPLWFLLLAATLAGLVALLFAGRSTMLKVLAGVGLVAAGAYVFTPLSAAGAEGSPSGFGPNLRYFSPGFALGLALLPLALPIARERRRTIALAALVAALLVGTAVQATYDAPSFSQAEIEEIANEGQDGFRSFAQETYVSDKLAGALLLAALLVLVPVGLSRTGGSRRLRLAAAGGGAAVVAVAFALGWPQARDYVDDRYDTTLANPFEREAGFRSSDEWKQIQQWGRELTDKRIAVVGRAAAFGQYVFYGPDISNHVEYVSERGTLGASRPIESCPLWRQELNEGDYDYVVITPRFGEEAFSTPLEIAWTRNDKLVKPVLEFAPAAVYDLGGDLDPARCSPATASTGASG